MNPVTQSDSNVVSRRSFLQSAAAFAGAAYYGTNASAAQSSVISFGFSLYGMRSLKVSESLSACADIGYGCVELACLKDWPCDPALLTKSDRADLRSRLNGLGLDVPCLMENLGLVVSEKQHQLNLERLKIVSELGHQLSPDSPPMIETVLGGKPSDWEDVRDKMVSSLKDWERVASAQRNVIAVKAHISGALHTPKDARWLVDQIDSPWIRLVYDYSHFQRQQFALKDSLDVMVGKTSFVHIKDNITNDGKAEFALPGDAGDIDYVAYLNHLKAAKYSGAFVVEVSAQVSGKAGYDPLAAARRCYANINPAFIKSGLRASL